MAKFFGVLTLLLFTAAALFLLYRSGTGLLGSIPLAPLAPVSTPFSDAGPVHRVSLDGTVPVRYPWQCLKADGTPIYRGAYYLTALVGCRGAILQKLDDVVIFRNESGSEQIRMLAPTHGVWTWQAPTLLENGNILTDLSHYLIYRQVAGLEPSVWAQVDGRTSRLLAPMGPADYGACFWTVAVRKPASSPPVASDKSNSVCLDPNGLPLPGA